MDRIESNPSLVSRPIPLLWQADISGEIRKKSISRKRGRETILNHIEKKYCVLVREIRERENVSYLLSRAATCKNEESRCFEVGKYTNEHTMRHFARYLNRGRLSRKNIDETIIEMKSLQAFCR